MILQLTLATSAGAVHHQWIPSVISVIKSSVLLKNLQVVKSSRRDSSEMTVRVGQLIDVLEVHLHLAGSLSVLHREQLLQLDGLQSNFFVFFLDDHVELVNCLVDLLIIVLLSVQLQLEESFVFISCFHQDFYLLAQLLDFFTSSDGEFAVEHALGIFNIFVVHSDLEVLVLNLDQFLFLDQEQLVLLVLPQKHLILLNQPHVHF